MNENDEPQWELDEELSTLTITFPTVPPVSLVLDAAAVSELIEGAGQVRAKMATPHSEDWQAGQMVDAVLDPRWYSEPDAMLEESLLHIRDPRYGWLHYALPRESAKALGKLLLRQAKGGVEDDERHRSN